MLTFLKSSCSILSKPSSWSTLEARVGGDSLLLKAGNKNRYWYDLLSSLGIARSFVYTKWLNEGMHLHAQNEHNKEYMKHMQHIKQQSKFNSWLLGFISSLDFFLPELIVNALNYHCFGQVHEHLWKENNLQKGSTGLTVLLFSPPDSIFMVTCEELLHEAWRWLPNKGIPTLSLGL